MVSLYGLEAGEVLRLLFRGTKNDHLPRIFFRFQEMV